MGEDDSHEVLLRLFYSMPKVSNTLPVRKFLIQEVMPDSSIHQYRHT